MKIEDCKTVPEFFGVGVGECIWVQGEAFEVYHAGLDGSVKVTTGERDSRALVGCLTGQLEWSREEPMTAEEKRILRELAAWFPKWKIIKGESIALSWYSVFGDRAYGSKAYEVLAPILEKYGEINLEEYR